MNGLGLSVNGLTVGEWYDCGCEHCRNVLMICICNTYRAPGVEGNVVLLLFSNQLWLMTAPTVV